MLTKVRFVGTNHFLAYGIVHMVMRLQHLIPSKYSFVVLVDPCSCQQIHETLIDRKDTLVILLMDDEKDCWLFKLPDGEGAVLYITVSSPYHKLYNELRDALIRSDKMPLPVKAKKYRSLFSPREKMFINLMMESHSFISMAVILNISVKKIYYCRASVMRKLNVSNIVSMHKKIQQLQNTNHLFSYHLAATG